MKKLIITLLAVMMITSLTACGSKKETAEVKKLEGTCSEIIDKVYEHKEVDLSLETTELDLTDLDAFKMYTGLQDADKVSEAAVSEPIIGSIPYSMVMLRVKDAADTEEVANAMKSGINQRKWVCVEADDLAVAAYGDVVMLFMVGSDYNDEITSAEMVEFFKDVCGGTLSLQL